VKTGLKRMMSGAWLDRRLGGFAFRTARSKIGAWAS